MVDSCKASRLAGTMGSLFRALATPAGNEPDEEGNPQCREQSRGAGPRGNPRHLIHLPGRDRLDIRRQVAFPDPDRGDHQGEAADDQEPRRHDEGSPRGAEGPDQIKEDGEEQKEEACEEEQRRNGPGIDRPLPPPDPPGVFGPDEADDLGERIHERSRDNRPAR